MTRSGNYRHWPQIVQIGLTAWLSAFVLLSGGCPPPVTIATGACCLAGQNGSSCEVTTQADCEARGGRYVGDDTECGGTSCVDAPPPPPPTTCDDQSAIQVFGPPESTLTYDVIDNFGKVVAADQELNACVAIPDGIYKARQHQPPQQLISDRVVIRPGQATALAVSQAILNVPAGLSNAAFEFTPRNGQRFTITGVTGNVDVLVPIGTYTITRPGEPEVVYLANQVFAETARVRVPIGALKVSVPRNAPNAEYWLWGGTDGGRKLAENQRPNVFLPTPPGEYRVTEGGDRSPRIIFATKVLVEDGKLKEIKLGAFRYTGPATDFAIFDRPRQIALAENRRPNDWIAVPAGIYRLVDEAANQELRGCYDPLVNYMTISEGEAFECR